MYTYVYIFTHKLNYNDIVMTTLSFIVAERDSVMPESVCDLTSELTLILLLNRRIYMTRSPWRRSIGCQGKFAVHNKIIPISSFISDCFFTGASSDGLRYWYRSTCTRVPDTNIRDS